MKKELVAGALATAVVSSCIPPAEATENPILQPRHQIESELQQAKTESEKDPRPNIVIVQLDDVAPIDGRLWSDQIMPTVYGTFIENGIQFSQYYAQTPLCSPSRATLLTGLSTQNHGVIDNKTSRTKGFDDASTIASALNGKGYETIIVGKYLNGFNKFDRKRLPGWDRQAIPDMGNAGRNYNYDLITDTGIEPHGDSDSDYSTDVFAQKAAQFIRETPDHRPIFAYINPFSSHAPTESSRKYRGDEACKNLDPWVSESKKALDPDTQGHSLTKVCETLLSVDDLVKNVKQVLEEEGRLDNTIFIFTSDNGMAWGDHGNRTKRNPFSVDLPLMISWPDGAGQTPRVSKVVLSNIDLAPTLAEAAGAELKISADGISFLGTIKNPESLATDPNIQQGREYILIQDSLVENPNPGWEGVITTEAFPFGNFKYVSFETGQEYLYDLAHDPNQLQNLAYDPSYQALINVFEAKVEGLTE